MTTILHQAPASEGHDKEKHGHLVLTPLIRPSWHEEAGVDVKGYVIDVTQV
jgi:hypothetical protein